MADTLLAIILATESAKGKNVVCCWPPNPQATPRLARPVPDDFRQYDNPWRASHPHEAAAPTAAPRWAADDSYLWHRPRIRARSPAQAHARHQPPSGRSSPAPDADAGADRDRRILGYGAGYLAAMLCPKRNMCHQKFALKVDELMFLGHPVCCEPGGQWRFKDPARRPGAPGDPRGRRARQRQVSGESVDSAAGAPGGGEAAHEADASPPHAPGGGWLQTFHVVFVHDLPDPSRAAGGSVQAYFDAVYARLAFPLTAVLFQEQVTANFVEAQCDALDRGAPLFDPAQSPLTACVKELFEAVKARAIARLSVCGIPLELQLPPRLDALIRSGGEEDYADDEEAPGEGGAWARDADATERAPELAPWKSLLLLDAIDVHDGVREQLAGAEDKLLAEQLIRFLDMADFTLSLADMASLLDWDLESQVYPIVRWLVHHRRARVVDIINRGLKTVFALPHKFEKPLNELAASYRAAFPDPALPALPALLATISQSTSTTFFASAVKARDALPAYHDVVAWLLRAELVLVLHLHVRVVAPVALKRRAARRVSWREPDTDDDADGAAAFRARGRKARPSVDVPRGEERAELGARWLAQSPEETRAGAKEPPILEEGLDFDEELDEKARAGAAAESDAESHGGADADADAEPDAEEGAPSIIPDPARADVRQRLWLQLMSEGKEPGVARRFEAINRYFDGKCADDEILFRAEISRKQLREVLHHYEEYVLTFLHPS